jgi:hypothetical protein
VSSATPVIYEVTLEVDPTIVVAYDTWLEGHMRRVLEQEGFESGHVFRSDEAVADGWQRRVVHYHVRSAADLERYLEQAAPALRAEGAERWGDRFRAARRVLTPKSELATPSASGRGDTVTECPNCGSLNIEKFCAACGQDNRVSVVAFPRLVADFLTDLFNFDSRLFGSLWPLLVRPGVLTKEYLAGRRARFIPPVRMYLFLSLFFFGVIAVLAPEEIKFDDDAEREIKEEVAAEKAAPRPDGPVTLGVSPDAAEGGPRPGERKVAGGKGWGIHIDDGQERVELTDAETGFMKQAEDRATHNLQKLQDDPEYRAELLRRGVGNLPLMMFLLLPIYALFLKLLYVRSGRYYVEHLIYSLHLHSFVFLTLGAIFAWLGALDSLGYAPQVHGLVVACWWVYFVLYPWLAMKRVYGQGWFKTSLKYCILGITYVVLLAFGLVFAVILTLST